MPRPSVVLDTNVVVSAHLNPNGQERFVLDLAVNGKLTFYYSEAILGIRRRAAPDEIQNRVRQTDRIPRLDTQFRETRLT